MNELWATIDVEKVKLKIDGFIDKSLDLKKKLASGEGADKKLMHEDG